MENVANHTNSKLDHNELEHNASETKALNHNKLMHALEGNKKHYKILQINSSNADFNSKLHELRATVNDNEADIVIVSESNFECGDDEKTDTRQSHFPDFSFEY